MTSSRAYNKRIAKWVLVSSALAVCVAFYTIFDPAENGFFPRCPFRVFTGLDCPGCGSQRAVHDLLHLDIAGAMRENLLLVLFLPYLATGFMFDMTKKPSPRMAVWRKRLFGTRAALTVLALILLFWVMRNIPPFADFI